MIFLNISKDLSKIGLSKSRSCGLNELGRTEDFFFRKGELRKPLIGFFRRQVGLLVGRFVFTPTQKVASKTFK